LSNKKYQLFVPTKSFLDNPNCKKYISIRGPAALATKNPLIFLQEMQTHQ